MDRLQKIVRLADLAQFCGLQRTQVQELIRAGKFPRPIKLGERSKGWLEIDLIAWQSARIAERDRQT